MSVVNFFVLVIFMVVQELPLGLLMKERRLRAELDVWKKQRPSGSLVAS